MKALRAAILLVCWLALFGAAAGEAGVLIERDVPAVMRDGIVLRADVHRPDGGGPYPVLVWRTPYGKQKQHFEQYVKGGYIVVCQDVRGRYASDGTWESWLRPHSHDAEDGYDTVQWAARLPAARWERSASPTPASSNGGWRPCGHRHWAQCRLIALPPATRTWKGQGRSG